MTRRSGSRRRFGVLDPCVHPAADSGGTSPFATRHQLINFSGAESLSVVSTKVIHMTDSASSFMAIIFGMAVFAVIMAVGWRSVQNRRILRLQGADGHETIIVASEDDDVSSVVTTTESTEPAPAPAPSVVVVNTGVADPAPAPEFGRRTAESEAALEAEADAAGRDRLRAVVSSNK